MKHRLLSLLLAGSLAMSGFSAVPYVLNESFESGIPASWSQDVMNSLGGEWRVDTLATNPAGAYDGEKRVALRALGGNVGYCVRLVTPELDLSQVNNPQLSFAFAQVRRAGAYQDTLSVYFRSSSASEWIMIRKYSDQQVGWSHQVLDLPALAKSPTCQFAFEAKENGGYGVVLDLVRVYPKSQCADVVLAAPTVGSNAARINWSANPRLFEVILSATAIADLANYDTSAAVYHANNLSGTTGGVTITNLDPQTHYFVYVRTDCDDNESGHTAWVSTDFTTTIGIPFTPVLASIPSAWEQKKGDAAATVLSSALSDNTTSYKWQSTSNTAVSGSAHLYAQSAGTPSWLLTQAIDLSNRAEESTVLLSFRLALTASATATTASTEAASTKFHVYASAGDGDSWQLVRTIEGSEISNTGSSYNVTLDDYLETGAVRLAFVADAQSSSAYIHLSDVNLAESDGLCLGLYGLKPSVAPNSITLSWSKIGLSATEVMLSDVADFSHILQQQTVSGITHTFNGLNTSETYFVKVRQDCENGDSLTLQLKTPCFPSTITAENPYTEGFEAYTGKAYNATDGVSPDCWMVYADGNILPHVTGLVGTASADKYVYIHDGEKALTFSGSGNCYAVLPGFTNELNSLRLSFWSQMNNAKNGTLTLGYIKDGDINMNTFTAIETYTNNTNSMAQHTIDLSELPAEAKYLVFRWYHKSAAICSIDDIELRLLPQCRQVKEVAVSSDAMSSELMFAGGEAVDFDVLVVTKRLNPDTLTTTKFTAFRDTVDNDTVSLTGLAPMTTYYVYVRPVCEEGETIAWSNYVSFTTPCAAVDIAKGALEEDFNSLTSGIPNCWDNSEGTTTSSDYKWSYNASGHDGACLRFDSYMNPEDNTNYLATPSLILSKPSTLSFWWKNGTGGPGKVLISTDGGVTRDTLKSDLKSVSEWTNYEIDLTAYTNQVAIIYFLGISNYGYGQAYLYLDDVIVEAIPTCHKIGEVSLMNATPTSATLRFGATNTNQYQVVVTKRSINPATADLSTDTAVVYNELVSTTQPVIPSLEGNSRYYAYVRGYCGGDDYSAWSKEFTFKTLCTAISISDFGTETFRDEASADCWTFGFTTPGSSANNAYAGRETAGAYGAYLKLSKESVGSKNAANVDTVYSDGAYAITPEFAVEDIRNYQVTFDAATTSSLATNYKRLNVGIMVDPNDLSGIDIIKTIDLDYAVDSTAIKSYSVSFANYEGDYLGQFGKYVIFQLNEAAKHDSTNFVLIDNVTIEPVASCEQVIEMAVDSLEGEWAAISWENTGAVKYQTMLTSFNTRKPDTISAPLAVDTVATTHKLFTGLTDLTQYYAYVRAICADGDTAKWSNPISFQTTQTPVIPPYAEDFETDNQWLFVNGSEPNAWAWGGAAHSGGAKALYISNDMGISNTYTNTTNSTVFAAKYIRIAKKGTYAFQYDWMANGESTYDYLRVALAPADAELQAGMMPSQFGTTSLPNGWIALDGGSKLNLKATWQTEINEVKVPAGRYKLVLAWRNDGSQGDNPPAAVDNFSVEIVNCPRPSGMDAKLTPGDGSVATLYWNKDEDVAATAWVLEYATDTAFSQAKDTTVSDSAVNLSGLIPETLYYARVKAVCGAEGESEWSDVITFRPTDTYSLAINNGTTTSSYVPFYGYYADKGGLHSQFIIPADSLVSLQWSNLEYLTFFASTSSASWGNAQFEVYMAEVADTILSAFMDESSMAKVMNADTLCVQENQMEITLDQPFFYGGDNLLIAFKQVSAGSSQSCSWYGKSTSNSGASYYKYNSSSSSTETSTNFLPKMQINYIPGVPPTCPRPSGIKIDHIDVDSARIAVPDLGAAGYHFVVATAQIGIDSITDADAAKIIYNDSITGDTVLHLNGLRPVTQYYIYVRAICDDEHSAWSAPYAFITSCGVMTIVEGEPWREGFETQPKGSSTSDAPMCWDILNANKGTNPYIYVNNSSSYVHSGSQSLWFSTNSSALDGYAVLPQFAALNTLQVEFYYRHESTTSSGRLYLGYMTNVTDTSTFVQLVEYPRSTSWEKAEMSLAAIPDSVLGNARLAIKYATSTSSTSYYMGIDDIKVGIVPSCLPATGLAATLTAGNGTIASLHWDKGEATSWKVQYATAADFSNAVETTVSDTAFLALSGLTPEAPYYARIRVLCEDGAISEWSDAISFVPTSAYELTINEGTSTNSHVPFDGEYADGEESHGQFIIPASSLVSIQGTTITQLTFYTGTSTVSLGSDTWEVYVTETSANSLSALTSWSSMTKVMNAATLTVANGQMVVTFDTPFTYENGNLLIGFKQTGGTSYSVISWIGVTATSGASYYSFFDVYYTYETIAGASSFLPKVTIRFIPSDEPLCFKPTNLAVTLTPGDGTIASIHWDKGEATSWKVQYATAADFSNAVDTTVSDTSFLVLSGLTPETPYYARVKVECEEGAESDWSNTLNFTPTNKLSLTVNDGTTSNDYVPIYGLWTDNITMSQFIIPASKLESLQWDTINQMTFYSGNLSVSWGAARFEIYMAEVDATTISALEDWSTLTKVKNAGSLSISGNRMVVTLDNPFAYNDGNLLIGFKQTVSGSYSSCSWYGVSATGASYAGYGTTLSQRNFLPKVTFDYALGEEPACIRPSALVVNKISTTDAEIAFKASSAPEYELVLTTEAIDPDTLSLVSESLIAFRDTVDTVSVAISRLHPSTDYYVYLRAICAEVDTASVWISSSFVTRCMEAVPYVMNFDNTTDRKPLRDNSAEMIPSCWTGGFTSTSNTSYIQNNTNSVTYAYSAPSALLLNSGSSSSSYVVLPELDASLDTLQLTFKARAMSQGSSSMTNYASSSYAHSIKVGTLTDPDSISTFRLLDTYELAEVANPTLSGNYWEDVTVYLQGAEGKYIALVSQFDKSNYVWIDNLEVSKAPDCIAPSGISVIAKTDGADVKWNSTAHRFEVALGQPGFTLPGGADTIFTVENAKTLHISDLTSDTGYEFYVRAECAEDAFSDWSRAVSFTTAVGVPFFDNFEDSNHWTLINGSNTNAWAWGDATSHTGSSSLYISNDGGAHNRYTIASASAMVYATRTIYVEEGGYIFNYDWKAHGESTYDYLRVALVPAGIALPQASTSAPTGFSTSSLPEGWIALDGGEKLNLDSLWTAYETDEIHLEAGAYTIVLAWKNDVSTGTNPPAAVDNFAVSAVPCSAPGAPVVSSITQNSAVIRWNATAPAYDVAVLRGEDTIVSQHITGKDSLVLENLSASTGYTVRLRAVCDDGETSRWSAQVAFATECGVINVYPWSENFDGLTGSSSEHVLPLCWNYINTCTYESSYSDYKIYPTVYPDGSSTQYSASSPNALRFYSYYSSSTDYDPQDQYAILPQMDDLSNKRLNLNARVYNTSYDATFTVGVMTNPADTSTFVALASFTPTSTTYRKYAVPFYSYTGAGRYIAIKMAAANSSFTTRGLYIDDLVVEEMNLSCLGVKDLTASGVSENGVQLSFLFEDGLSHDAEVAISRESAYDPSTALQTQAISGNSYTFNLQLEDQSTYYLYARQSCGEGEYSAWEQLTLKTHFSYIYEEEFTSTTLPDGWQRYSGLVDDVLAGTEQLQPSTSGWQLVDATAAIDAIHFKGNIYGGSWKYWVVSPAISIDVPTDTIVALRFDAAYNKWNDLTTDPSVGDDDRFAVLVSTDDGQTWHKLSEWNNAGTGDHVLSEVPKEGQSQMVSLSPYIGQTVRIAFYGESTASNADNDFHFGNIAITYATGKTFAAEICDGDDYVGTEPGNSFSIASDEYHIGENVYDKYILAPKGSGLPDSILTLRLTVHATHTYEDSVLLCEGEAFADSVHGAYFSFTAQMGMTDRVAFVQNQYGCEDIVKLLVKVNPKQTVHIYDSIAQGDNYQWHGRVYMSATVAQFDTVSAVTGCDSTVYLHLSVYQKPEDPEDQAVENIYAQSLIIAPNPVKAGEPIHILNSFSSEMLAEARIEIFSAAGALVYTQHGAEKPLILPGIPVSGLYTVRIIVGDEIFISSLLVH